VRIVPLTPRYVDDLLLVEFAPSASAARRQRVLKAAGVTIERRIGPIGVVVVTMPAERRNVALARLDESPWVRTAEKSAVVEALETTPNDVAWPGQWGLRTVGLPAAWDRTRGSSRVVVAVVDTGVDATHPDLHGAVLPGLDLVNGDSDPSDDHGHGTAVAGIIAARTNNVEGMAGVCWSCSILPVKVLDADGLGDSSLIAAGIVRAVDAGADVVNLSLGGPAGGQALDDAVAYAGSKGVLVVASTGNNGVTTPFYPAASPGAISVAATDESDHLYPWSNSGPWAALAAPGCNHSTQRGGGYGRFCGTSSAAPLVSGLVALALSARPTATRDEVMAALDRATSPIGGAVSRGRVDAAAILAALEPATPSHAAVTRSVVAVKGALTGRIASRSYRLAVGAGTFTTTLSFTGSRALRVEIRDHRGFVLARRTGSSPLRISRTVQAGSLTVQIGAHDRKTAFKLALSYTR
jgi:subtilisin family serine protease